MWLLMYFKRLFKTPFFIALIIIFPLCAFIASSAEKNSDEKLMVGLFFENKEYSQELSEKLQLSSDLFNYKAYADKDIMRTDILKGALHCGYIIDNLFDENKLSEKSILCIKTNNSMLSSISDEAIFTAIQELYGYGPALSYKNAGNFTKISEEEIKEKYAYYTSSDLTYSFDYEMIGNGYSKKIDDIKDTSSTFPSRAIGSVIIMLASIFGAVRFHNDDINGLHKRLSPDRRFLAAVLNIFSIILLTSVSVFISVIFSGAFTNMAAELLALTVYTAISVLFGVIIAIGIKDISKVCAAAPILVIGTLIFCPVFINTENYIPFTAIINKIFIPYYYLAPFNGKSIIISIIALFVFLFMAFLLYIKEK